MVMYTGPKKSPEYALHRVEVTAADILANVKRAHGINCASYASAHIQVVPSDGANPNVAVYWWSEKAGVFIQEHTPITKAGVAPNTPFEFTVECAGRIMFVAVTAIVAGKCSVMVSGYDQESFG